MCLINIFIYLNDMCLIASSLLPRCPYNQTMKTPLMFIESFCELNSIIIIIIAIKLSYECQCDCQSLSVGMQDAGSNGAPCPSFFFTILPTSHPVPSPLLVTMVTFLKHKLEYYLCLESINGSSRCSQALLCF